MSYSSDPTDWITEESFKEHYEILDVLGKGTYCTVFKGKHLPTGEEVHCCNKKGRCEGY